MYFGMASSQRDIHTPQRVVQPGTRATASLRACRVRCAKLARRDLLTAGRIEFDVAIVCPIDHVADHILCCGGKSDIVCAAAVQGCVQALPIDA
jgi:hypothetical protein